MYVEINIFALVILFLIFFNMYHRSISHLIEQRLFLALLWSNVAILILDTIMWIVDGKNGLYLREFYYVITALYYTMNPVISMIWSFYADYQIYRNKKRLKKLLLPLISPVLANMVLSFLSIKNKLLFNIDNNNIYHRGKFFLLMASISYIYLFFTLILIIVKQKKIQNNNFIPILAFAIPPFVGGIIQSFYYGVSLVWVCMTISILIIFLNLQNDQLYRDHLTGLFNRRQLDNYIKQLIHSNTLLAGIMIDLDSFKKINDLYGHDAGDQALIYTAKILKKTFKNDFIARYGGDEFIVMMEISNKSELTTVIESLKNNINYFNSQKIVPYKISVSIGFDFLNCKNQKTVQRFFKHIDNLMYKDKLHKEHPFIIKASG
ncbi:MAG: GGDEF domain-containing protein [Bacillota bacterium]|nr:GGDEF domain-containing protein [Bacillota bacterium]